MEHPDPWGCLWKIVFDAIIVALIIVVLAKLGVLTIHWPVGF